MSDKPVDLSVIRGKKAEAAEAERCDLCNGPKHEFWLGCQRVDYITVYSPEGHPMDIHFHPFFFDDEEWVNGDDGEDPDDAA